jgi:DNA-binding NarL/FixJ family response regulator
MLPLHQSFSAMDGQSDLPEDARIRVLVVDDHPLVRQGLEHLINQAVDLVTCGLAADAAQALVLADEASPDVIVVDLSLGGDSGLDLIGELVRRSPAVPVLALSMLDETVYAERALRAGARGYVMKGEETDEVLAAIRSVHAGERYLGPRLRPGASATAEQPGSLLNKLSDREFQVFELVGRGLATREIAQTLGVGVKTVETHRHRIKEKLGFKAAHEVVHFAIRWVEQES